MSEPTLGPFPIDPSTLGSVLTPAVVGVAGPALANSAVPSIIPGADQINVAMQVLTSPDFWKRVGIMSGGLALIYFGALTMLASSPVVRGAATTAVKAAAII